MGGTDTADFQSGGQMTSGRGRTKHYTRSTVANKRKRNGDATSWTSFPPTCIESMDINNNTDIATSAQVMHQAALLSNSRKCHTVITMISTRLPKVDIMTSGNALLTEPCPGRSNRCDATSSSLQLHFSCH